MRPRLALLLAVLHTSLVLACGSSDDKVQAPSATAAAAPSSTLSGPLSVFAASSLTDAFDEIGQEFQKLNPRVTVKFNYAASPALRTQLEQGARADVFASADQIQMDNAKTANVVDGAGQLFVKNKLVMIYPTSNPGKVSTLQDLARPGLKFVLTDKSVPIGAYARSALEKASADPAYGADFSTNVLANLRSEEANVRAVVTKVQLGEADAGIVYASDVTPAVAKNIRSVLLPDAINTIATYPIAVVRDAGNKAAAQAFIRYVRSAAGQNILKKWNFITDNDTGAAWSPPAHVLPRRAAALPARRQPSHVAQLPPTDGR